MELKKTVDLVNSFTSWRQDFPEGMSTHLAALDEEMAKEPSPTQALVETYHVMAIEIFHRALTTQKPWTDEFAEGLLKDVTGLIKFVTGHLQLTKKIVAGVITERLDLLQKD